MLVFYFSLLWRLCDDLFAASHRIIFEKLFIKRLLGWLSSSKGIFWQKGFIFHLEKNQIVADYRRHYYGLFSNIFLTHIPGLRSSIFTSAGQCAGGFPTDSFLTSSGIQRGLTIVVTVFFLWSCENLILHSVKDPRYIRSGLHAENEVLRSVTYGFPVDSAPLSLILLFHQKRIWSPDYRREIFLFCLILDASLTVALR